MITIDGSIGEGGGQILRTALALSMVTGEAFRITGIRAGRKKPGLLRQHLTAVNAASEISGAKTEGTELGSSELVFKPGRVKAGNYKFAVGTAGSTTLVLQTVLPALILGTEPSSLILEGGTHNPMAPPFDFLERAFLPLLQRMGPRVVVSLERPGFYPAGGGRFVAQIKPVAALSRIELLERGEITGRTARAIIANLPRQVAERELKIIGEKMNWSAETLKIEEFKNSIAPGNLVVMEMASEGVTEVVTAFGERGVPAEHVANNAVQDVREYLAAGVPVGVHLADQLILPIALAGGGSFRTLAPSRHTLTNIEVIEKFLPVKFQCEKEQGAWVVRCGV